MSGLHIAAHSRLSHLQDAPCAVHPSLRFLCGLGAPGDQPRRCYSATTLTLRHFLVYICKCGPSAQAPDTLATLQRSWLAENNIYSIMAVAQAVCCQPLASRPINTFKSAGAQHLPAFATTPLRKRVTPSSSLTDATLYQLQGCCVGEYLAGV